MILTPPHLLDSARWRGLRIGVLGGSFNPPHEGHVHISRLAHRALRLDAVWWLLTPQNPLKSTSETMSYEARRALCLDITRGSPEIIVTDLEARLGTSRSFETMVALRRHYPGTDFVMVTGMDNALTLHRWQNWQRILATVATAHIARPPAWTLVEGCPLRSLRSQNHIHVGAGRAYPLRPRTSFWIMQTPMRDISSTKIRNLNKL